jgi:N-acetylglutamate synthase-like GNAT family acetyltransferase
MIRQATEQDFDRILAMSELFWKETLYSEEFSAEATLPYIKMAFECGLLAVAQTNGNVKGFCAAVCMPMMGSGVMSGTELAWWIDEDARGGRMGIQLLGYMEYLAKNAGVKYWNMVAMRSSMFDSVCGMYRRLGYRENELIFTRVF